MSHGGDGIIRALAIWRKRVKLNISSSPKLHQTQQIMGTCNNTNIHNILLLEGISTTRTFSITLQLSFRVYYCTRLTVSFLWEQYLYQVALSNWSNINYKHCATNGLSLSFFFFLSLEYLVKRRESRQKISQF